ncbi:MAG: lytic transglycosylase domain-containing protein [Treponematales bacterium]
MLFWRVSREMARCRPLCWRRRLAVRPLFLPLLLFPCLATCGGETVFGLPLEEARERLRAGDAGFLEAAALPEAGGSLAARVKALKPLGKLGAETPYFAGLLARAKPRPADGKGDAAPFFVLALDSPSAQAREEAARELLLPALRGEDGELATVIAGKLAGRKDLDGALKTLAGAGLYRLSRYAEARALLFPLSPGGGETESAADEDAAWNRALGLFASWRDAGEAADGDETRALRDFLLGGPEGEAWNWAAEEAALFGERLLPPPLAQALAARTAAAARLYPQALELFTPALKQDAGIFPRYPELLSSLGRAFTAVPRARREGASLFRRWGEDAAVSGEARYRSLFFAARLFRQLGDFDEAGRFFSLALEAAPDPAQSDACIWYLLDTALAGKPQDAAALAVRLLPRRHSAARFSDILDRLSRSLASSGRWDGFAALFPVVRAKAAAPLVAQYAWITGRALEEGFIAREAARLEYPPEMMRALEEGSLTPEAARAAAGGTGPEPRQFFKVAYEEGGMSFYYRALGAARLGESLALPDDDAGSGQGGGSPERARFLLSFFEYGAAEFVWPKLLKSADSLSVPELRLLAGALAGAGKWQNVITLTGRYMAREGFTLNRTDLALRYPRPFRDLIEKAAGETGLRPELLYGLVFVESAFNPAAVSRSGAVGLTQLMPATALATAAGIARGGGPDYRRGNTVDATEPEANLHIGAVYLRQMMDSLGSPLPALLAYNGGPGRTRRWLAASRLPPDLFPETIELAETRNYGRQVASAAAAYGFLYYGLTMEAVISGLLGGGVTGESGK